MDLINRKTVKDYLREQQANLIKAKHSYELVSKDVVYGMEKTIEEFINFINQVPTDFGMDKLVDQLEREKKEMAISAINSRGGKSYTIGYINGINRVLDLIGKECADETAKETD